LARIAGVDLPAEKRIEVALTYIYGIGNSSARRILKATGVNPNIRVKNLSDEDTGKLRTEIETRYKIEGALRSEIGMNVKRLMDIGTYRGLRHRKGLPVRGQRTRTNARTRKGPKKAAGVLKKRAMAMAAKAAPKPAAKEA
jgi:small subunit ribosomal protein S13